MSCHTSLKINYFLPSKLCSSLIIQYEHVKAEEENFSVIDRHIPSGYVSLVFNTSGYATIHKESPIQLPKYFIVAPLNKAINIGLFGKIDSFIITCRASVFSRLFSLNLQLSDYSFFHNLENERLQLIEQQFIRYKSPKKRISIIEEYFTKIGLKEYVPDTIDTLYNHIMDGNGCIPIATQIEQFKMSPRYFRQHFSNRVGLNAKSLARIVRANYLWSNIINHQAVDFQKMVFEGDYFDQAHLIHDFKQIVGETPSYFFKRNLDNIKIISGKT